MSLVICNILLKSSVRSFIGGVNTGMFCRMIHGVNIKDGKASYVARFVRTARLQQEESYGAAKFMKVTGLTQLSLRGGTLVHKNVLKTEHFRQTCTFLKLASWQMGQLKGLRGLFYLAVEKLRMSLGVLDDSYGIFSGQCIHEKG